MNLKVLIIEDESIVALHIKKIIQLLGHQIFKIVKTGLDAIQIVGKTKIDLIISDINIKGEMDGIKCCQILQKKHGVPVIFITAYRDIETLKRASNVDFIGYLVKPFREDELETMIQLAILKYGLLTKKDRYLICDRYSYCYELNSLLLYNNPIELTKKENKFLLLLVKAKGSVVSYSTLEHKVWDGEQVGDNARRQLVHRFKQKVPNFPMELVKGIGYKLTLIKRNYDEVM